jgi:hypothetical protein
MRRPKDIDRLAWIEPTVYDDPVTGDHIAVTVSDNYSTITVNDRQYFFIRETGVFDGDATIEHRDGPILVTSSAGE